MLALAIGGCFCNDLRYVAEASGTTLGRIAVTVTLSLDGDPLLATGATMEVSCERQDGSRADDIVARATAISTVANSLRRGVAVAVTATHGV